MPKFGYNPACNTFISVLVQVLHNVHQRAAVLPYFIGSDVSRSDSSSLLSRPIDSSNS